MTVVSSAVASGSWTSTGASVASSTNAIGGARLGGTTLVGIAAYTIADTWARETSQSQD